MTSELLNELMDAGMRFSLANCDKIDAIAGRMKGEHSVLLGLLVDCAAVIKTIEGEDSDEAGKLNDLLSAIDRAIDPSRHKGALL